MIGCGTRATEVVRPGMMWSLCAVWCRRRMGLRHCRWRAWRGMWSACGRCWTGARRSTRLRWVVQGPWHGTAGAIPAGVRGSLVACMCRWWDGCPPRGGGFGARGGPGHVALEGTGSILIIGRSTRVTELVRRGMMCGLCVPCGVVDGRDHAALDRQSERACGVCAGVVGRGRCDQPGDGEFRKVQVQGTALRGLRLFPLGSVGTFERPYAAGRVVALRAVEVFGQEVVQPMFHLKGLGASW
jgi:hypothetical protein